MEHNRSSAEHVDPESNMSISVNRKAEKRCSFRHKQLKKQETPALGLPESP